MSDGRATLAEVVAAMLIHAEGAATEFVRRQQPPSLPLLAEALDQLSAWFYELQLRDPAAFLRAKYPDPLPALDAARFRAALDAAFESQSHAGRSGLADLGLADLMAYSSLVGRLQMATKAVLDGRHRPTLLPAVSDVQGRLFPEA